MLYTTMIMTFTVGVDLGFVLGCFLLIFYHIASMDFENYIEEGRRSEGGGRFMHGRRLDKRLYFSASEVPKAN